MLKWMKSLWSFQNAATKEYIIVGLGNPGSMYDQTRHNVGFRAVRYFAKRHSISLKRDSKLSAEIGTGWVVSSSVKLLFPLTYMNNSGEAVKRAMKSFNVPVDQIAVVVDDIAFPVGEIRFKEGGSHGGHNGLRSIEEQLGTRDFPRLRIGVGHPQGSDLAEFVLSPFEARDEKNLPEIFNQVSNVLECWISNGIQAAMTLANTKKS